MPTCSVPPSRTSALAYRPTACSASPTGCRGSANSFGYGAGGATTMSKKSSGTAAVPPSHGSSRSEEHTSELQSLMRISYAVFCLKKKSKKKQDTTLTQYKVKK